MYTCFAENFKFIFCKKNLKKIKNIFTAIIFTDICNFIHNIFIVLKMPYIYTCFAENFNFFFYKNPTK